MPRPPKYRRVALLPPARYFKPAGVPLRALEEVILSLEEAEAIRLKDLEGLDQEQSAQKMNISRPTFQRVLKAARQKIAEALLRGKAIRIEGGTYEMAWQRFRCGNGHQWDVPLELMAGGPPRFCPTCNTVAIDPLPPFGGGRGRAGRGRHRGLRPGVNRDSGE